MGGGERAAEGGRGVVGRAGARRLRFAMVLGPGPSGLTMIIGQKPDMEAKIIANRQKEQAANMRRCVEGIRDLVEGRS